MKYLGLLLMLVACDGNDYGERCTSGDECEGSLSCRGQAQDEREGFCLYVCEAENGFRCPDGYDCVGARDLAPKNCLRRCQADLDCPDDWRCVDAFGPVPLCMPVSEQRALAE